MNEEIIHQTAHHARLPGIGGHDVRRLLAQPVKAEAFTHHEIRRRDFRDVVVGLAADVHDVAGRRQKLHDRDITRNRGRYAPFRQFAAVLLQRCAYGFGHHLAHGFAQNLDARGEGFNLPFDIQIVAAVAQEPRHRALDHAEDLLERRGLHL